MKVLIMDLLLFCVSCLIYIEIDTPEPLYISGYENASRAKRGWLTYPFCNLLTCFVIGFSSQL